MNTLINSFCESKLLKSSDHEGSLRKSFFVGPFNIVILYERRTIKNSCRVNQNPTFFGLDSKLQRNQVNRCFRETITCFAFLPHCVLPFLNQHKVSDWFWLSQCPFLAADKTRRLLPSPYN